MLAAVEPEDRSLQSFEENGYLIARGLLDVRRDLRPLLDEYEGVLDRWAHKLVACGELSQLFDELPFDQRFIRICEESGRSHCTFFDITLPQAAITAETEFWTGPAVFGLLRNPTILDAVEGFIGPEIYANPIQHVRIKPPQRLVRSHHDNRLVATPWHQDNGVILPQADRSRILTVWLPLTEASARNGCLRVIPGSHKWGLLPHAATPAGLAISGLDREEGQLLPMIPGDVLFMHRLTCHSSLANLSEEVRISVDLRYNPIGEPTGRPSFPGFVARSSRKPNTELRDPWVWQAMWAAARDRLASTRPGPYHRW